MYLCITKTIDSIRVYDYYAPCIQIRVVGVIADTNPLEDISNNIMRLLNPSNNTYFNLNIEYITVIELSIFHSYFYKCRVSLNCFHKFCVLRSSRAMG